MTATEVYHAIIKGEFNQVELVAILELCAIKLEINTISEMARIENKSPNGIMKSNRYRKIKIGKQLMSIKLKTNKL